ncbi:hypothetical protein MBLNU230_g8245t1 [Neophaeotheca triangularis]
MQSSPEKPQHARKDSHLDGRSPDETEIIYPTASSDYFRSPTRLQKPQPDPIVHPTEQIPPYIPPHRRPDTRRAARPPSITLETKLAQPTDYGRPARSKAAKHLESRFLGKVLTTDWRSRELADSRRAAKEAKIADDVDSDIALLPGSDLSSIVERRKRIIAPGTIIFAYDIRKVDLSTSAGGKLGEGYEIFEEGGEAYKRKPRYWAVFKTQEEGIEARGIFTNGNTGLRNTPAHKSRDLLSIRPPWASANNFENQSPGNPVLSMTRPKGWPTANLRATMVVDVGKPYCIDWTAEEVRLVGWLTEESTETFIGFGTS